MTDVRPLTGGTQNIVVRLCVDGRPMVLRRPPAHPRPTSDKTMLREIAVLRTLAGTTVPHPGFIAGCDDLDVLGVVFYLMQEVDGFNPGNEIAEAYVRDAGMRHDVGLSYVAGLARLGNVPWEGSPLAAIKRAGILSGAPGSAVPAAAGELPARELRARIVPRGRGSRRVAGDQAAARRQNPASCTATPISTTCCCAGTRRSWPRSSTGRCARSATRCSISAGCWSAGRSNPNPINAGAELAALGGLAGRAELVDAYLGGRRSRNDAAGLVSRDGVFQARHRHRRHLVALPGRAGELGGRRAAARVGAEPDRLGTRVAKGDNPFELG